MFSFHGEGAKYNHIFKGIFLSNLFIDFFHSLCIDLSGVVVYYKRTMKICLFIRV